MNEQAEPDAVGNQRAKRDTGRKRQSIMAAAVAEFCRLGYEGTSMDRIAEKAGASKRTVYNHFPSKELLFQEILRSYAEAMQSRKRVAYDAAKSLEDQLSAFADAELAILEDPYWKGFTGVLVAAFIRDPAMARDAAARNAGGEDPLAAWIRAADRDGRLKVDDPQLAAGVFQAMVGGAFVWPAVYRGGMDPAAVPAMKAELVRTFLSRYRPPRAG